MQDAQSASVDRIRGSLQNALSLIEDLHEFARIEVGELRITVEQVTLRELLHGLVEEYRAGAVKKSLELTIAYDHAPDVIRTDERRVRQIVGNLISNAIKYTEAGRITLQTTRALEGPIRQSGEWVALAVTDTGVGIAEAKFGQLFKEFSRLDPDDKPGAGLGLAISQRLAEALGGRITVLSSAGHGSTFTLWLPLTA
jgi:signal transduction histidine kinase